MQRTLARNLRDGTLEAAQKTRRRGAGPGVPRASRLPLEFIEGNAARTTDTNALPQEQSPLFLETTAPSEGDPAAAVDDAVPGKPVFPGRRVEDPDDLAGGPVVSGEGGDLGVGSDFPARDRPDHVFDTILKFHSLSCR
jgi:hypothetical protein